MVKKPDSFIITEVIEVGLGESKKHHHNDNNFYANTEDDDDDDDDGIIAEFPVKCMVCDPEIYINEASEKSYSFQFVTENWSKPTVLVGQIWQLDQKNGFYFQKK